MFPSFTQMIHIGEILKQIIEQKSIIKSELATKMGLTNSALHKILNKEHINTEQIKRFSEIMNYNFFEAIAIEFDKENKNGVIVTKGMVENKTDWKSKYYQLADEMRDLQREYIKLLNKNNN